MTAEEAIALANNSPFVLGGSVYATDIEHGKRVGSCIETGMVFINYPSLISPDLPIGGIKRFGNGRDLSNLGIEDFINKKLVCVANRPSLRRVNGVDLK
jgi:succinate-semialdehyde dehydrogenase/glutarate-semialdehyde dehydrogenase